MSDGNKKMYGLYTVCYKCRGPIKTVGHTQAEVELKALKESYLGGTNKLRCKRCKEWVDFDLIVETLDTETSKVTNEIISRLDKREIEKPDDLKPEDIDI